MNKTEKTKLTINKILEAAMNEFGKNGYAAGTINNICSTGINKGLLYHNFDGKDDIYLACVKQSCDDLLHHLTLENNNNNLTNYMSARMDFFINHSNETHIFFEALLTPPPHLSDKIQLILSDFNELNKKMYTKTLDLLTLRNGVSKEDAISYFHLMQLMLNGYFSSPAFQTMDLQEKIKIHESTVTKLLDYMLYGIAKGEK